MQRVINIVLFWFVHHRIRFLYFLINALMHIYVECCSRKHVQHLQLEQCQQQQQQQQRCMYYFASEANSSLHSLHLSYVR